MPRFARKKDGTHEMVADAFRQAGWSVLDVYRAPECPDFFAAHNGRTIAVEVKSTRRSKLTPAQQKFLLNWQGEYYIVRSADEVADVIRKVVKWKLA